MSIQARIPSALACVHNFIRIWDPLELEEFEGVTVEVEPDVDVGTIAHSVPTNEDREFMSAKREQIVKAMWISYTEERARRGNPVA